MKTSTRTLVCLAVALTFQASTLCASDRFDGKPSPDEVIEMLQEGNERYVSGESEYPHTAPDRMALSSEENQGDHAFATVITCSDSRVPVELLFDSGIMDIFVIRVAGNVCDTDEVGSIEYGLGHVNTPVLVVLGHSQCGAVTAVTHVVNGQGGALERNIPPLVDNIIPAVKRAQHNHPYLEGDDVIPLAIEENVWQGVSDLFTKSPATRDLVNEGKVKVVGAIYDVGSGKVSWLPEEKVTTILAEVEASPEKETVAFIGGDDSDTHTADSEPVDMPEEESVSHEDDTDTDTDSHSSGH